MTGPIIAVDARVGPFGDIFLIDRETDYPARPANLKPGIWRMQYVRPHEPPTPEDGDDA